MISNTIKFSRDTPTTTIIVVRKGCFFMPAKKDSITANWLESRHQWVAKSREYYKGETFDCSGSSKLGKTEARKAWKRNYDKHIAAIDKKLDIKVGKIQFKDYIWNWYNAYKRHEVGNGGRSRSARTVQTDEDTITQICVVLGTKLVSDIDSDMIQQYMLELVQANLADSTIRKRWNMLSMFFKHVYPDGGNPMSRCKRPQSTKETYTWALDDDEDEPTNKYAYTDTEMQRLEKELCKNYNPAARVSNGLERGYLYGKTLVIIMYQFLRVGEAVELRVKDIDFAKNKIHVRRQYDEQHKLIVPPKWGSRRDIPIASACREILEKSCDGKQPNELVFSSGILNSDTLEHEGHILRGGLRRVIGVACERAGLEIHTIHDLRHDGISWIVRRGARPQSVQKWAGHKSLSVTLDRYYRHTMEDNPEDMALMTGTDN